MRILLLLFLLVCTSSVQAQGFLRNIRERVESTINNAVEEVESITNQEINEVNQDVYQSTDGIVEEVVPQVSTNGVATSSSPSSVPTPVVSEATGLSQGVLPDPLVWGASSGNDRRAIDQVIQGLRLAMPAMHVGQILQERGYERQIDGAYAVQHFTDDGRLIRTQRIRYLSVEPSQEFIDELEPGELKDMILEAQRVIAENQQAAQSSARAARDSRSREARRSATSTVPRNLELVFLILYEQIYQTNNTAFDFAAAFAQARDFFGPSTFDFSVSNSGMAFNKQPERTLIFHDAALLPDDYKTSLVKNVPGVKLGHMEAVYRALLAPCGGAENPWGAAGGGGCPNGYSDAYPDFEKQMELNRAVIGPYMRIQGARSGSGIETRLEWSYLNGERRMRERHAEETTRQNTP
ncbi:MAG: hypothetical protein KJN90_06950, partial [Gammaproteobacteria bacterium]|nr:hypothetical protein [Gammaproteobacteria bacterium]